MRRMAWRFLVLGLCLAGRTAHADEIVLHNGDRISGEIVRLERGKLLVKTPYAGDVRIDWAQVATLSTDEPVYATIDQSNRIEAVFAQSDPGSATLSGGNWLETSPLPLGRITAMTRKPEPPVKVTGHINVGASATSGNTDTEKVHADMEVVARSVENRFTIGGAVNKAEDSGVQTESNWIAYLKYDHFITRKWYAYSNADMESDEFKDINLRTTLGVGTGYQFLETPATNLSLEGGLNYVNTDFDMGADESYPAGRWALKFDHYLFGSKTQAFHRNEGFSALDDSENLFVRTQSGLRWPVIARLSATAQYNVDWDANPAPGRARTDRTVLFTLGYNW
jgi:putative salt-induced outer membrane protein YdiY